MNRRVYLSGPMTGLPLFNVPAFTEAAAALRAEGYEVVNPAELDLADTGPMEWADYIRRDLPELCKCNIIALLPGWEASRGAKLEFHVAAALDFEVIYLKPKTASELAAEAMAERE
jgi:hypothetical protein